MKELWKKYNALFLYLVFGVLTTAINIVVYHMCYEVAGIPNVPSNMIAWVLSVLVAYLTNKIWVFHSRSFAPAVLLPELWKFVSCRLFTGAMDTAIMWVGVDLFCGPATVIKIGSNVLVVVLNYVFSKLLIFREEKPSDGKRDR